ncbi:Uncharacterised protein [Burkholderia pseudomallei]|uniref:hypothetical protein n=1 Tax=Burkholderia pseudomallei TaxID=28450 RepID=UPI000F05CA1F|nr:hypothetical protein [Burkholderia pseudomallei]CAJ6883161.1 Uncharacterised protein [Burkholderia pseudomallei]VBI24425.1 Uncharacterised protein [Burkholderia pseudomallei]
MTEFDLEKFKAALTSEDDPIDVLEDLDEFMKVTRGQWVSDHKHEHRETVYLHKPSGRFVTVAESRSGSYWSDYEYDAPMLAEVEPREITKTVYHAKGGWV